jgi:hypothetical protein
MIIRKEYSCKKSTSCGDRPRPVSQKTSEKGVKILLFDDRREEFGGF